VTPLRLALTLLALAGNALAADWVPLDLGRDPGPYRPKAWKAGWPGCSYEDGVAEGRFSILLADGTPWLRVLYPKGSVGPEQGGGGWRFPLPGIRADNPVAELQYAVLFEEGFDFVKGGKLPGLCGGPKTITGGDPVNGSEGWSARLMWRKDGSGQAYVYHMHQPEKYGDEFDFPKEKGLRFQPGIPATIRLRVAMNTPGRRDGSLSVWVNGDLLVDRSDMEWRAVPEIGVDSLLFNTFHGGTGPQWAPARDCHARFANFQWRVDPRGS
jgi:hypothetical protein